MSTTRKKIESFYNEVTAVVDKFGGRKADLNKTQKYSDNLIAEISSKAEDLEGMKNLFIQADENFHTLDKESLEQGMSALNGMVEAAKTFRNSIVGLNNDMCRKALKLKTSDVEKYLKQLNGIEKDISKFVEKNSNKLTADDEISIGGLGCYIKIAKDDLCAGVELKELHKKFDNTMPIFSTHACSQEVAKLNKWVNNLEMYYAALVIKFMPASVYNSATFFQSNDAGSSKSPSSKKKLGV